MYLDTYSAPTVIDQLGKIMKNYYDALTKTGFSLDTALKIITSKQLISVNRGLKYFNNRVTPKPTP